MTDDYPAEWVTIKVPKADRERSKEYRPDGATYGDCLVAGAERLNDHPDSDDGRFYAATEPIFQAGDDEPVDEIVTRVVDTIGAEVGGPQVDDSEIAREVAAQIDYVELASKVADELEGRMR